MVAAVSITFTKLSHRKKCAPRLSNQKQNRNPTLLTARLGSSYFPPAAVYYSKLTILPNA